MIVGTVLNGKPRRTYFGLEYVVKFDDNPDAKAMSGDEGPALASNFVTHERLCKTGDRVRLEYRVGLNHSYGLWFIIGGENDARAEEANRTDRPENNCPDAQTCSG